jgi:hypothetical protein
MRTSFRLSVLTIVSMSVMGLAGCEGTMPTLGGAS